MIKFHNCETGNRRQSASAHQWNWLHLLKYHKSEMNMKRVNTFQNLFYHFY